MKYLLQAKNITKKFSYPHNIELIKDVSLELAPQTSIAIVGSSGVGKSTLLHILGTLEPATGGSLVIAGKPAIDPNLSMLRNQHIGFIFQTFNLLEDHTVLQNILMPALIANKEVGRKSYSYNLAKELLEKVKLSDRANYPAKLLSGGEKQRVAIARALLNDPEILLADEPTGNLDRANTENIHDLLLYCVEELGKGLIVVTHDPTLAKKCHKTFRLQDGTLI